MNVSMKILEIKAQKIWHFDFDFAHEFFDENRKSKKICLKHASLILFKILKFRKIMTLTRSQFQKRD